MNNDSNAEAAEIARLITASIKGRTWRQMTPLMIAEHLIANGVRTTAAEASA